ncbi:NAD(P)/FAD-dependent oxidoreductase [Oricola thermophila]|uniref:FAD-dependent oxidoreductase n=1 Tax=Oricola thermophila TaxID=2742145 RepID=A0A6N1VE79_9HYPH|nr:FAD-dependent oxidoreductase [Oricola thermophila]QKV17905.1 FAD-dependent oxidoreductase [Oricola thermophila]
MRISVVGAGIAGLSVAWALSKRGHQVMLFEQGPVPNPMGASGDHHRIIRRAYGAGSGYGAAISEAYEAWNELWADLGRSHLDPRGFMAVSREPGDEAEDYLNGLREGGWPCEVLDPGAAAERWPFLDPDTIRYAFHSPEGGALLSRRIAFDMAAWMQANGVMLRQNMKVAEVDPAHATVTTEDGRRIEADYVVVTAGAWVTKLFPDLATDLTAYRTAVVYLDPPAHLKDAWAGAPVILDVGGETDGYILPPSGDGGLKFGSGLHKRPNADADANREPEEGEGEIVRDLFAPPMRDIGQYRVLDVVTCAYTFTPDERFFVREQDNCLVVSACSGHGYKFGAAVGRRVADFVAVRDFAALRAWMRAEG